MRSPPHRGGRAPALQPATSQQIRPENGAGRQQDRSEAYLRTRRGRAGGSACAGAGQPGQQRREAARRTAVPERRTQPERLADEGDERGRQDQQEAEGLGETDHGHHREVRQAGDEAEEPEPAERLAEGRVEEDAGAERQRSGGDRQDQGEGREEDAPRHRHRWTGLFVSRASPER
ncbi:MAG: hypothetical protein PGN25_10775 [Methylorubrum populi]